MLSVIQKIYLGVCTFLFSTYSVFACINDAYTIQLEELWGKHYNIAFEINLAIAVIITLFASYILSSLYHNYIKDNLITTEKFFTLFMLFLLWFLIFGIISPGESLFTDFLLPILVLFFGYYAYLYMRELIFLLEKNSKHTNYIEVAFLGINIVLLIYLLYLFTGGASHGPNIFLGGIMLFVLPIYILFTTSSYRLRICTVIILTFLLLNYLHYIGDFIFFLIS